MFVAADVLLISRQKISDIGRTPVGRQGDIKGALRFLVSDRVYNRLKQADGTFQTQTPHRAAPFLLQQPLAVREIRTHARRRQRGSLGRTDGLTDRQDSLNRKGIWKGKKEARYAITLAAFLPARRRAAYCYECICSTNVRPSSGVVISLASFWWVHDMT